MTQHSIQLPRWAKHLHLAILAIALCTTLAIAPASDAKRFRGDSGSDTIVGTKKKDNISARGGNDTVRSRKGSDTLKGGSGGDDLKGAKGKDKFNGGKGNDQLKAVDGKQDRRINGGDGDDTCLIDQLDLNRVSACETLQAEGDAPAGSLELRSATGLTCASELPTCAFTLAGTGAEALTGTVSGGGGANPGEGASVNVSGEEWDAAGAYGCTDDGFLRVTIGSESVDVPITCKTASP